MKHNPFIILLLFIIPQVCYSQTEMNDSIRFRQNVFSGKHDGNIGKVDSLPHITHPYDYKWTYNPTIAQIIPFSMALPFDLNFTDLSFTPGQANLFNWNKGEILATGETRLFPGLMKIDSGAIEINQSIGNLTFNFGGMVNKYGYFNGLHTQYGLNGSITYQYNPRLTATVFGDYYFGQPPRMANGLPMPPAMIGFYGRSKLGGYLDFRINERWGVQTGVQTVQQFGTNRFKAEPIVTPYYKINKKVAIGLPFGQILYHVLKK